MKWAMVIDLEKCTLCGACVMACAMENNIPLPSFEDMEKGRLIQWIKILNVQTPFGEVTLPFLCMHCDNPPCTKVCPVDATGKDSNGIVRQIYGRCIGCRYCTNNCPYTIRSFNWKKPKFEEKDQLRLNPKVSVRPMGVVEKCTFCYHRLQEVEDKASFEGRKIQDGEYIPACAEICPSKAITFGDIENPSHKVSELIKSPKAFRLYENLGTEPKVYYLKG